jgi:hypothetical protein
MRKKPDRLFVEKNELKNFKLLQEEKDSPLYKKENKDVFMMALMMGLKNGARLPLRNKEGFIREDYLSNDEKSIIKAIAVNAEENLSVLLNLEKIYQIAEEYAAGGIKYLVDSVFKKQHGSYATRLETELIDICEKYKL